MIPGNNLRDNMFMHPVYGPAFLTAEKKTQRVREALKNLFDMVQGECPSLLRDHHLFDEITAALQATEPER